MKATEIEYERRFDAANDDLQREREAWAERLRALGKMCHDINNPLTALMGRAQILKMRGDTDPHVKKAADTIEQSAKQVAELIRQLAHMVRQGRDEALRAAGESSPSNGKP